MAEIRSGAPRKQRRQLDMHQRIQVLDRRSTAILAEFQEISRKEACGENWLQFTSLLTRVRSELTRIEVANGL